MDEDKLIESINALGDVVAMELDVKVTTQLRSMARALNRIAKALENKPKVSKKEK